MYLPPEWPPEVRPPSVPDWEASATAWLLDALPADYRQYEVLRRHPVALVSMASAHVEAAVQAARAGYRKAAVDLKAHLPPHAIEAVLDVYRHEGPRLVRLSRSIEVVGQALRGEIFTATLRGHGRRSGPAR
ncbi:hypothetical protein HII36_32315 [Nonomuraea sp. NN258]|uniref:hypothetical protein n=1 Tax=Nonomuraea antri TaxID=2730852 RepID=UPI00156A55F6|nr:hypothetical protein [Nonomuraea antri]NRQ36483.1 hypothetical protein [Nonomuraea antri]